MTINIHGKEYVTVAERLQEIHKTLKTFDITTEVLLHEPVVIKATVKTEKGTFTGVSAANPSKSIEATSPYEVAETSAVGRALIFAGFSGGDSSSIASAEEIDKAIEESPEYQRTKKKALRAIDDWTLDQVKGYELEFGKYKGIRLEQLIGDKKAWEWFNWIIDQKPTDERGEKVLKIITRFIDEILAPLQEEETA